MLYLFWDIMQMSLMARCQANWGQRSQLPNYHNLEDDAHINPDINADT